MNKDDLKGASGGGNSGDKMVELMPDGSIRVILDRPMQTTVHLDTSGDELKMLRDVIIRAHQMTGGNYAQTDTVMRARAFRLLDAAIDASPVMRGFLGRGGPCADRDILAGSGDLS